MDSRRQLKVAHLLQEVFSTLLLSSFKQFLQGAFVTLTRVNVTSDLALARFNISVLGNSGKQDVIDSLNSHKYEIRKILGNEMRNDLRKIPELEFYLDDTLDYVEKMDQLFEKIKKEDIS